MTANDLERDLERDLDAIREQLRCDLGNDTLRKIYADCLEENGYDNDAAWQRAIAEMALGLRAFVTDIDDLKNAYLSWLGEPEGLTASDLRVGQRLDETLLVASWRIYEAGGYDSDGWYVTCESRGDLTVAELEREIY